MTMWLRAVLVVGLPMFGLGMTLGHFTRPSTSAVADTVTPSMLQLRLAFLCGRVNAQGKELPLELQQQCDATHLPTDIPQMGNQSTNNR